MNEPKQPTKRTVWLSRMRIAGFHNDSAAYTRLLIEAKVNRAELELAWREGVLLKQQGALCGCSGCIAARAQQQGARGG